VSATPPEKPADSEWSLDVVCDTPYPSENDRGVIVGCGRKFEPTLGVVLDESRPDLSAWLVPSELRTLFS
jgi:hypothetical protein